MEISSSECVPSKGKERCFAGPSYSRRAQLPFYDMKKKQRLGGLGSNPFDNCSRRPEQRELFNH